uniref:Putative secreted protein n=1 Tax=Anopheles darlingi TaxID=43151 RepID=A0A2M4DAF5_ANODA
MMMLFGAMMFVSWLTVLLFSRTSQPSWLMNSAHGAILSIRQQDISKAGEQWYTGNVASWIEFSRRQRCSSSREQGHPLESCCATFSASSAASTLRSRAGTWKNDLPSISRYESNAFRLSSPCSELKFIRNDSSCSSENVPARFSCRRCPWP